MILPLEKLDAILNDRLRTSQCYPGSIVRSFWEAMQSTSTRDGLLNFKLNPLFHFTKINFHSSAPQGPSQRRYFPHGLS